MLIKIAERFFFLIDQTDLEMVGHTRLSQIRITSINNNYLLRLFRNYGRSPMWSSSVFHDQLVVLCLFWFANYIMTSTTNVFEVGPHSLCYLSRKLNFKNSKQMTEQKAKPIGQSDEKRILKEQARDGLNSIKTFVVGSNENTFIKNYWRSLEDPSNRTLFFHLRDSFSRIILFLICLAKSTVWEWMKPQFAVS